MSRNPDRRTAQTVVSATKETGAGFETDEKLYSQPGLPSQAGGPSDDSLSGTTAVDESGMSAARAGEGQTAAPAQRHRKINRVRMRGIRLQRRLPTVRRPMQEYRTVQVRQGALPQIRRAASRTRQRQARERALRKLRGARRTMPEGKKVLMHRTAVRQQMRRRTIRPTYRGRALMPPIVCKKAIQLPALSIVIMAVWPK